MTEERFGRDLLEFVKLGLERSPSLGSREAKGDAGKVIPDPAAKYFGAVLDKDGLAPSGQFIAGPTRFADWARA